MRRRRQTDTEESEVNLTPMLDVVFIMLIFFIVTASFVKEAGIDISRPPAATAERKERGNILVAITENDPDLDRPTPGRPAGPAREHRATARREPAGFGGDPGGQGIQERPARPGDGRGATGGSDQRFPRRRGGGLGREGQLRAQQPGPQVLPRPPQAHSPEPRHERREAHPEGRRRDDEGGPRLQPARVRAGAPRTARAADRHARGRRVAAGRSRPRPHPRRPRLLSSIPRT